VGSLILLFWTGAPVVTVLPMWNTYAVTPLLVGMIVLVVEAACSGVGARFLQVSLLHVFILLQVRPI